MLVSGSISEFASGCSGSVLKFLCTCVDRYGSQGPSVMDTFSYRRFRILWCYSFKLNFKLKIKMLPKFVASCAVLKVKTLYQGQWFPVGKNCSLKGEQQYTMN